MVSLDHKIIFNLIEPGSRVLDLGCGDGELLSLLIDEKNINGQGIEVDEQLIYKCVAKGLNVFHGDIESGLAEYPDKSFDYVILDQSMQQIKRVDFAINEALRVGRKVIISFPNFAHWIARLQILLFGRVPVTPSLPYKWHSTPNLHFLSISDFWDFTKEKKIKVLKNFNLSEKHEIKLFPNLFARAGIFVLTRQRPGGDL